MTSTVTNNVKAAALIALGLAIAVMGVYVADVDDAPGAAAMGFLLMFAAVVLAVRTARNRLPIWAGRTALTAGALIAVLLGFLTHEVTEAAQLYAQPQSVPSVMEPVPSPQYAAAIDRARELVPVRRQGHRLDARRADVEPDQDLVGLGHRRSVAHALVHPTVPRRP